MSDWQGAPDFITRLPLAHRRIIGDQCDWDWRRCTEEPDGSIMVHNRPQMRRVELAPEGSTAKRIKKQTAAPRNPRKQVTLVKDVQPVAQPVITPPQPRPEPPKAAAIPVPAFSHVPENTDEGAPASPKVHILSGARTRTYGILDHVSDEKLWEDEEGWENTLGYVHQRCANGVPDTCSITIHPDVLAMWGIDLDLIESVARNPDSVEIAPESTEKHYPILRFRRGDIMAVIGFKYPRTPSLIAAYVNPLLIPEVGRPQRQVTGGGGKRKKEGVPERAGLLIKALKFKGAELTIDLDKNTATVTYKGQDLGQIETGEHTPKDVVSSSWQRMQRKMNAIDQRETANAR